MNTISDLPGNGEFSYQTDLQDFSCFLKSSKDGSLDKSDPVYSMTDYFSKRISYRFDRIQDAEDLRQRVLIILMLKARYEGLSSLKTYIYKIVFRERLRMFREERNMVQLDEISQSERLALVSAIALKNMESDPRLAKLMKNSSNFVREVMTVIANFEKNRPPRKSEILKALQEQFPGQKFTRYGVEEALKALKRRLS